MHFSANQNSCILQQFGTYPCPDYGAHYTKYNETEGQYQYYSRQPREVNLKWRIKKE